MKSCHGYIFHITDPLWGECNDLTVDSPNKRTSLIFFLSTEYAVEQRMLPVAWDAMTHCGSATRIQFDTLKCIENTIQTNLNPLCTDLCLGSIEMFLYFYHLSTLRQHRQLKKFLWKISKWRYNERDGVSNHQPHDGLLSRLFRQRSKKTSKLRVTGLCAGNSPVIRW